MPATDLHVGDVAPRGYIWNIPAGGDLTDVSIVTAVTATITRPGGTPVEWTLSIVLQSAETIRVRRAFQVGDLVKAGWHEVVLHLVTPIGTYDADADRFEVKS